MKRYWRIAGGICIAHVVLLLGGYSQQRSPMFGSPVATIVSTYAGVPAAKMYLGGFIVTVAWLLLLAGFTLIGRLLAGATAGSGWFAGLVTSAGTAAAVITLAGAYATAGAAYYGATHGYAADTIAGLNMASKFADFIAIAASGVCALAVGGAALSSRLLPRWAGWLSLAVGVVGVAAATGPGLLDIGTLVWLAWLIVIGIVLMRGPARGAAQGTDVRASEPAMAAMP